MTHTSEGHQILGIDSYSPGQLPPLQIVREDDIVEQAVRRRAEIALQWTELGCRVVLAAGQEIPLPGTDLSQFPFNPDPDLIYLAGGAEPGWVLAFDPPDGWTLFVHMPTPAEQVWTGDERTITDLSHHLRCTVTDQSKLEQWLRSGGGGQTVVLGHSDLHTNPGAYSLGTPSATPMEFFGAYGLHSTQETSQRALEALHASRMRKDGVEIMMIRHALEATRKAYGWLLQNTGSLGDGSKTDAEIGYMMESIMRGAGCPPAYPFISGSGPRAASLHGSSAKQRLQPGSTLLVDTGAKFGVGGTFYCSDITRVTPIGGAFSPDQRTLYEGVRGVQRSAIERCRLGTEFIDVHRQAIHELAAVLLNLGLLNGSRADRVADGSVERLFTLHGLGHALGLDTHDMGRYRDPGKVVPSERGLPGERGCKMNYMFQEGHVTTVEPGLYLAPWVLGRDSLREEFAAAIRWTAVDNLLTTGSAGFGVRHEDDVLITARGPVILSAQVPMVE